MIVLGCVYAAEKRKKDLICNFYIQIRSFYFELFHYSVLLTITDA